MGQKKLPHRKLKEGSLKTSRIQQLILMVGLVIATSSQALKFDGDVPAAIKTQMQDDLLFMAGLQGSGSTNFHKQIFGEVDGLNYKNFFESHIDSVGLNSCGGGNAVACVIPFYSSSKMWLTKNFINFSHPQVARMMVVYHESRHAETNHGNWSHDTCPDPFLDEQGHEMTSIWTGAKLAGQPACDSTAFGSYGSSTILLKNISKFCANCSEKVKMDADIYATDQLGRIDRADVKQAMLADFDGK
jgi:hypothetical protein